MSVILDLLSAPTRPDGRRVLKAGVPFYARVTHNGADTPAHLVVDGVVRPLNASVGSAMYRVPGEYTLRAVTGAREVEVPVIVEGELPLIVTNHQQEVMSDLQLSDYEDQGMDNVPGLCADPYSSETVHHFWAGAGIHNSEITHAVGLLDNPLAFKRVGRERIEGNPFHDPYVYSTDDAVVSGGELYLDAGPVVALRYHDLLDEQVLVMLALSGRHLTLSDNEGTTYGGTRLLWRRWSDTTWRDAGSVLEHAVSYEGFAAEYTSYLNTVNGGTALTFIPDYGGVDYLYALGPRVEGRVYGESGDERNYKPCVGLRIDARILLRWLLSNSGPSATHLWRARSSGDWLPQGQVRHHDCVCPGGGYLATQFVWSTHFNRWLALWQDLHGANQFYLSWSDKLMDAEVDDWAPPKLLHDPNDKYRYGDCPYFVTTDGTVGKDFDVAYSSRAVGSGGWKLRRFSVNCS